MKTTTKKKAEAVKVKPSHGEKKTETAENFIIIAADRLAQAVRRNYENNTRAILATGNDDISEAMEDYRTGRGEVMGVPDTDLSIIEERE